MFVLKIIEKLLMHSNVFIIIYIYIYILYIYIYIGKGQLM